MKYKVIGRLPAGWDDTGALALTEKGMSKYIELIGNRLPEDIFWCADDTLIVPVDSDAVVPDIDKIVSDAFKELLEWDEPGIWEDEYNGY